MTNADKNVRPGMTAAVSIITASKENVLVLPNRAIHSSGGQHVVTIVKRRQSGGCAGNARSDQRYTK